MGVVIIVVYIAWAAVVDLTIVCGRRSRVVVVVVVGHNSWLQSYDNYVCRRSVSSIPRSRRIPTSCGLSQDSSRSMITSPGAPRATTALIAIRHFSLASVNLAPYVSPRNLSLYAPRL